RWWIRHRLRQLSERCFGRVPAVRASVLDHQGLADAAHPGIRTVRRHLGVAWRHDRYIDAVWHERGRELGQRRPRHQSAEGAHLRRRGGVWVRPVAGPFILPAPPGRYAHAREAGTGRGGDARTRPAIAPTPA